jgi:hypothetical protein
MARVTVVGEEFHLDLPGIRRERPAVAEHHGLSLALVGAVDLSSVRGGEVGHGVSFSGGDGG